MNFPAQIYAQSSSCAIAWTEQQVAAPTPYEFLQRFGSPAERIELEVSRTEIWRYGECAYTFHNGILVTEHGGVSERKEAQSDDGFAVSPAALTSATAGLGSSKGKDSLTSRGDPRGIKSLPNKTPTNTRELLNEIMQQFPYDGAATDRPSALVAQMQPPASIPSVMGGESAIVQGGPAAPILPSLLEDPESVIPPEDLLYHGGLE